MDLVWRLLPVALIASTAESDRPLAARVPNDQVPTLLVALAERMLSYGGDRVVFFFERLDLVALLTHGELIRPARIELRPGRSHAPLEQRAAVAADAGHDPDCQRLCAERRGRYVAPAFVARA